MKWKIEYGKLIFSIFFGLDLLFIMRSKYFAVVIGLSGVQFGR